MDNHEERFLALLEQSEKRIDRTSEMIYEFSKASKDFANGVSGCREQLTRLTEIYERHIVALEKNRDEITRQNSMLIEMISRVVGQSTINISK